MTIAALSDNSGFFGLRPSDRGLGFSGTQAERVDVQRPQLSPAMSVAADQWIAPTLNKMRELDRLEHNWDGRGSAATKRDALQFSLQLLDQIMAPTSPAPGIVPLGDGGVLLIWHNGRAELEVEVSGPNDLSVTFLDKMTGHEAEWPVAADFSSLAHLFRTHFRHR
jgi:hypothetical protein